MTFNQFKMENVSIKFKMMREMCRLCLSSEGTLMDMFSFSSELESIIADAVIKCTSVHVKKGGNLPSIICEQCYEQLIKTQNFQRQALKSDKTLQLYLEQVHDDDKQNILGSSVTFPNIEENSSVETSVANQDNQESTNCENIPKNILFKNSESGCIESEINIAEMKVDPLETRSHTEWDFHSSGKDSTFNPNSIIKDELIIKEEEDLFDTDTETLNFFSIEQENIKSNNEVFKDKMTASYYCDVCNKTFKGHLKSHQRVHTGEKPHQCDVCNRRFRSSSDLIKHQRVHTGEKPYQCDVCTKSFSCSANFKRHQRVHTGEKPYQCDVCYKRFSSLSSFKNHPRVHDKHNCDVCDKSFSRLDHFRNHQRMHTGEKPYQCDVCNKQFGHLCALNSHKRIH